MLPRTRIVLVALLLTVISFLDHQFFYEPRQVTNLTAMQRQLMHLLVLVGFIPTGLIALKGHRIPWLKKLWVLGYAVVIVLLTIIGMVQWKFHAFSIGVLDVVSSMRIFVTSPLPFLLLCVIAGKLHTDTTTANR